MMDERQKTRDKRKEDLDGEIIVSVEVSAEKEGDC